MILLTNTVSFVYVPFFTWHKLHVSADNWNTVKTIFVVYYLLNRNSQIGFENYYHAIVPCQKEIKNHIYDYQYD